MQQLELDFEGAIALARIDPVQMELKDLLGSFESSLKGLEREEKLRLAGRRFVEMAEVLEQKAEAILGDWGDRHNDDGPIPDDDFLAGLVQETMFLDLSEVVRSAKGRKQKVGSEDEEVLSTVSEMDKTELLGLLETAKVENETPAFSIEALEDDEDVDAWIQLIREFMIQSGDDEIVFSELIRKQILSQGKAWMAMILGKFHLEHSGDFYQGVIRVRSP